MTDICKASVSPPGVTGPAPLPTLGRGVAGETTGIMFWVGVTVTLAAGVVEVEGDLELVGEGGTLVDWGAA